MTLGLSGSYFEFSDQMRALSRAKHKGLLDAIPALADKAAAALVQVDGKALLDRLTLLGMSMAHGKSPEEQQAWLHETTRLLSDLPHSVLFDAIDECVKEPGRVFAPSVGEIRDKAAGPLQKLERQAARLRRYAMLLAEGIEIPQWVEPTPTPFDRPEEPKALCTPAEAKAILAEYGLKGLYGDAVAAALKPEQPKSRADLIAEGIEPPRIKPLSPDADFLTV